MAAVVDLLDHLAAELVYTRVLHMHWQLPSVAMHRVKPLSLIEGRHSRLSGSGI